MKTRIAALALLALPALCRAYDLDAPYRCDRSAHDFVAPLIEQGLVDSSPFVGKKIDGFRPVRGSNLRVLRFRVLTVMGYQPNDPIFLTPALPAADSYGVLVFGSIADVQASLSAIGSRAKAFHAGPHLTAIACLGV